MTEIKRLYALQVNQLYNRLFIGIIATLLNALILVLILMKIIPLPVLLLWFSAISVISFLRGWLYLKFQRTPKQPTDFVQSYRWFVTSMALSGIIWGAAGIFLFPIESVTH